GGQIAGGKRMAQSVRGIFVRWIGKQQVAGRDRLKKAIEGDEAPIERGECCAFDTLLGAQTHQERKAAFVEFPAPVLAWSPICLLLLLTPLGTIGRNTEVIPLDIRSDIRYTVW